VNLRSHLYSKMIFGRGLNQRRQPHRSGSLVSESDRRPGVEYALVDLLELVLALVPIERSLAENVEVADEEDRYEHAHFTEQEELARFVVVDEDDCPGVEEDRLDVEDDEEHCDQVELDREALSCIAYRGDAALVGGLLESGGVLGTE